MREQRPYTRTHHPHHLQITALLPAPPACRWVRWRASAPARCGHSLGVPWASCRQPTQCQLLPPRPCRPPAGAVRGPARAMGYDKCVVCDGCIPPRASGGWHDPDAWPNPHQALRAGQWHDKCRQDFRKAYFKHHGARSTVHGSQPLATRQVKARAVVPEVERLREAAGADGGGGGRARKRVKAAAAGAPLNVRATQGAAGPGVSRAQQEQQERPEHRQARACLRCGQGRGWPAVRGWV